MRKYIKTKLKNVPIYIDLAFCLIVLPIMAILFPVERWYHNFQWYMITVGAWLYILYFINRTLTVPALFKGKRYRIRGVVLILLSILITYFLSQVTLYNPKPNVHDSGIVRLLPKVQQYQQFVWSLFMIVEAFSFAVGLMTQAGIQRAKRRAVEQERDRAEIELYKAQIKPHFMFNTLNSLYGLFLTQNDKALESLEKFISMMRYIHTTAKRDMVALSDEVDYINQYIDIQSLRLNEMTDVDVKIEIEDRNAPVPPMLLVTFIENCFKHGISPVEKSSIIIRVSEKQGKLDFSTQNRIFPVKRIGEHMGITNCRRRLEMIYPGKHMMETFDDGEFYKVKLSIELAI